jgi:hypothetical protein
VQRGAIKTGNDENEKFAENVKTNSQLAPKLKMGFRQSTIIERHGVVQNQRLDGKLVPHFPEALHGLLSDVLSALVYPSSLFKRG